MADKPDILYLEIDGSIFEEIKVFGQADVERNVAGLKKTYKLTKEDDYIFFFKRKSKVREQIIKMIQDGTIRDL